MLMNIVLNNKGSALVTVIMMMVVLTILGLALLNVSLAETKHSVLQERKIQAHYLARSGVNVGLEVLKSKMPYNNDIQDLINELNNWASVSASLDSPAQININEEFTLAFELMGSREIKIIAEGIVRGKRAVKEVVTLRVKMLTSLLTGGKAEEWYVSHNSHNLRHSNNPDTGGYTYLGKGVLMEGKGNSSTHFPSNAGGEGGLSIFQASVMQFLKNNNNVSLDYSGSVQDTRFDAEIIIIDGAIRVPNNDFNLYLSLTETVAQDKINNNDSVLYVEDPIVRENIRNGVGFESEEYYNYFIKSSYAHYDDYAFQNNTRYGIVYFGGKLVQGVNDNQVSDAEDRLPNPDSGYMKGYFYYPHDINLNPNKTDLSSKLIPIREDDPIISLIEGISKVRISSQPYLWDDK
jgi:hypothetical protein